VASGRDVFARGDSCEQRLEYLTELFGPAVAPLPPRNRILENPGSTARSRRAHPVEREVSLSTPPARDSPESAMARQRCRTAKAWASGLLGRRRRKIPNQSVLRGGQLLWFVADDEPSRSRRWRAATEPVWISVRSRNVIRCRKTRLSGIVLSSWRPGANEWARPSHRIRPSPDLGKGCAPFGDRSGDRARVIEALTAPRGVPEICCFDQRGAAPDVTRHADARRRLEDTCPVRATFAHVICPSRR